MILSLIYAFGAKKVWLGEFQIVLVEKQDRISSFLGNSEGLAELINISGKSQNLKTEVEILKSPSVMMGIFNFVKKEYQSRDIDISKMKYDDWLKGNLSINLKKGTSIVNLKYKDSQKDIILPVLKKFQKLIKNIQ